MTLDDLGWSPFFEAGFLELARDDLRPARVVRADREACRVVDEQGEALARVSGRLAGAATDTGTFPAVGDWVAIEPMPGDDRAIVHAILPRRSKFSRKVAGRTTNEQVLAANIDTALLVSGLDNDFNLRRIERYLTLVWDSGASPVILLNKADVCADLDARIAEVAAISAGVPVIGVSASTGKGMECLATHIKPRATLVLLGSSGVGKSTLINRLMGQDAIATAPVRDDDSRGRHTTTARQLHLLRDGAMLIDTPGMRELQVWGSDEALPEVFAEIGELAEQCRFGDCAHQSEPGCAVKAALESGDLNADRFESFQKLQREFDSLALRQDEHERRAQGRRFGRMVKQVYALKKKD